MQLALAIDFALHGARSNGAMPIVSPQSMGVRYSGCRFRV
jgi:hypothetical protein